MIFIGRDSPSLTASLYVLILDFSETLRQWKIRKNKLKIRKMIDNYMNDHQIEK